MDIVEDLAAWLEQAGRVWQEWAEGQEAEHQLLLAWLAKLAKEKKTPYSCQTTLIHSLASLLVFLLPVVRLPVMEQWRLNVNLPHHHSTKVRPIRSFLTQVQIALKLVNINSVKKPYLKKNANKVGDGGVPIQIDMAKSTAGMNSISKQES